MAVPKCEACGLIGAKEYVYVRTLNGGLNLCATCLAQINGKNPELVAARADLARVLASAAHVKMGGSVAEVCDRVVRAHDEIVALRAERDRLRYALTAVQQWGALNPPQADLCGDLPWLKQLVDAALTEPPE